MKQQLFTLPIITAVQFDGQGRSCPRRVSWQGRDIAVQSSGASLAYFCSNGRYFWLERQAGRWHIMRAH